MPSGHVIGRKDYINVMPLRVMTHFQVCQARNCHPGADRLPSSAAMLSRILAAASMVGSRWPKWSYGLLATSAASKKTCLISSIDMTPLPTKNFIRAKAVQFAAVAWGAVATMSRVIGHCGAHPRLGVQGQFLTATAAGTKRKQFYSPNSWTIMTRDELERIHAWANLPTCSSAM
jgi:hypothetical protein